MKQDSLYFPPVQQPAKKVVRPTSVTKEPFKVLHKDNTYVVDPTKKVAYDAQGTPVPDEVYDVLVEDKNKNTWLDMANTTDDKVIAKKILEETESRKAEVESKTAEGYEKTPTGSKRCCLQNR